MTEQTGSETPNPGQSTSDLPEWARTELSNVRQEAAKYRTQQREKSEELTATLNKLTALSGEKESAAKERDSAKLALLRLQTAIGAGIPGEHASVFAARLQGTDEETLKQDADELKKIFNGGTPQTPRPATDPSQSRGSGSNGSNSQLSPAESMQEFLRGSLPARFERDTNEN